MHVKCSFQSFHVFLLMHFLLEALMYIVINYQKGEIESTFAPFAVLLINVNIHVVGLTPLSSIFQISTTVA